jgi:Uma2 family endonuclease
MASVLQQPQLPPPKRLLTAADLAALPDELPSGPVKYELDQGRLVTLMAPPGSDHGRTQLRIGTILYTYATALGLGEAFAEVGLILRRNPDTVVAPDAAFVAKKSLPVRTSREGYLETIPELVVEVRSKNDSTAELLAKADDYLRAGVQIVWIIDPATQKLTVCRPQQAAVELGRGDTLAAEGVIPGFQVAVAEVFGQ